MKAVILAGGLGTRLAEETYRIPKPMVTIGGYPILWHIMKIYHAHGIDDFIVCCGHLGYIIKEYFFNYALHTSDVRFDFRNGSTEFHRPRTEPWRVALIDTGQETMTGGRLKRVAEHLDDGEPFLMTYGDGVADIDITGLIDFHRMHGQEATMTVVRPPGRFGATVLKESKVCRFTEKPECEDGYINGGFFVLEKSVIARIPDDAEPWEREPLASLVRDEQLAAFKHRGFWQPMDTIRERKELETLWASGKAPWKIW